MQAKNGLGINTYLCQSLLLIAGETNGNNENTSFGQSVGVTEPLNVIGCPEAGELCQPHSLMPLAIPGSVFPCPHSLLSSGVAPSPLVPKAETQALWTTQQTACLSFWQVKTHSWLEQAMENSGLHWTSAIIYHSQRSSPCVLRLLKTKTSHTPSPHPFFSISFPTQGSYPQ